MKFGLIILSFLISSLILVFFTIEQNASKIYDKQIEEKRSKLKSSSSKSYKRAKKEYLPQRSYFLSGKKMQETLVQNPISFEVNKSNLVNKITLNKIVKLLNKIEEDVVLSIEVHTDKEGTAQHNLLLSQKRADKLKAYFMKKTKLPLVVAIGYGEAFALKNRIIKFDLKRIKL